MTGLFPWRIVFLTALFALLISQLSFASVLINEIMYNPAGDEFDFEYIELYGEGENISLWYFEGIDFTFPYNTTINGFLAIANTLNDSGENNDFHDRYPNTTCNFEFAGNLLNTGETIILRDASGKIIDVVTYGGWADENHSIERILQGGYSSDPDNWQQSIPGGTPGRENSVTAINTCDWSIQTVMNSSVSVDPTWQIRATKLSGNTKANLTIALWVEDAVGILVRNYSAIIIENALAQSTSGEYTPSLSPGQGYFIKASIVNMSCSDLNNANNGIAELIFVPANQQSFSNESRITTTQIPSTARFGDVVTVEVDIYRGDTAKFAVHASIKDGSVTVSETTTIHLKSRLTNYTLRIPIQLKPNCEGRYDDGKYDFFIEGLGVSATESIRIDGTKSSLCGAESKTTLASSSPKTGKTVDYQLLSSLDSISPGEQTNVQVKVIGDSKAHTIDVWARMYRGPKTYLETAQKQVALGPLAEEKTMLPILIDKSIEDGMYKLKVSFRKDGQKTTHDITQDIIVKSPPAALCESPPPSAASETLKNLNNNPGIVIYESSSMKAREIAPLLMSLALVLIVIALVFKKI